MRASAWRCAADLPRAVHYLQDLTTEAAFWRLSTQTHKQTNTNTHQNAATTTQVTPWLLLPE